MSALIGFTIIQGQANLQKAKQAQAQALAHFPHLTVQTVELGKIHLTVWGHGDIRECTHTLPDGSRLVLLGPQGQFVQWNQIQAQLAREASAQAFELPWEGRVILMRVHADGSQWTIWNDWLGGIPMYHAAVKDGHIVSTLETVVVAGAEFTPNDIFLPGLISIFSNGHTISDWTFYKGLKVVLPDSVSEWSEHGMTLTQRFTIKPTAERAEASWDDLIDEMHTLIKLAIGETLNTKTTWLLPLSSGLDSRIIAAVGAESGADLHAYTWGSPKSEDAKYAPQIARTLGIPWKWLNIGTDYMAKYVRLWADLFGSATHFHGMYQMPFLDALKHEPAGRILSGFLGDTMAGFETQFQMEYHTPTVKPYQVSSDDLMQWTVVELRSLLKVDLTEALEEVAEEIHRQRTLYPGPWYQQVRFLTLWGRQRHFTYFQTKLGDYWRGVDTPYIHRAYARFCYSLPRLALDERLLLGDVIRRYYGKLAVIPGSFAPDPLILTGTYLLQRHIRRALPPKLRLGPFRDLSLISLSRDAECIRATGARAIWPIRETWKQLGEWLNLDLVEQEYQKAVNGNIKSVRKLMSVQTLAYRLMET